MGIRFQKYNILESSTVTVSSEDSSYPKYRLYDRDIGLFFKSQSYTGDFIFHIDQGASDIQDVYGLIIPAGHNLNNINCALEYSDDDSSWTTVLSFTPPDTELINYDLPSRLNHRYWRLVLSSLSSYVVEVPEIVLLDYFTLDDPVIGHTEKDLRNYVRLEASNGKPYFFDKGEVRKYYSFDLLGLSNAEKQYMIDLILDISSGKPLYFHWEEENLVKNPGFEDSADPDWWTNKSSSVTIETTGGNNSDQWIKLSRSEATMGWLTTYAADGATSTSSKWIEVNPGEVYEFGGDIKTDGTANGYITLRVVDEDYGNQATPHVNTSSTSWETKIKRYTIPDGKKYINLCLQVYVDTGWAGFDNVFLRKNTWTFVELVQDPAFISTQIANNPWKISLDLREVLA